MNQVAEQLPVEEQEPVPVLTDEELFEQAYVDRHGGEPDGGQGVEGEGEEVPLELAGEQAEEGVPLVEGEQSPEPPVVDKAEGAQAAPQKPETLPDGTPVERPDWYNELPQAAKDDFDRKAAELNQLNWQYSTVHGRLAPVQQENERLQRRLVEAEAQNRTPQPETDFGTGGQSQHAATPPQDLQASKELAEFAEAFPDEARAIEAMVGAKTSQIVQLTEQVTQLSQGLTQVQQSTSRQTRTDELTRLTTAHPDWAAVRNSQEFNEWNNRQPASIQALVNSQTADDCIWIMDAYKAAVYLSNPNNQMAPPGEPDDPAARQTREHRATLRQTPTSPAPIPSGVSVPRATPRAMMSDEDMFAAEADRRHREHLNNR